TDRRPAPDSAFARRGGGVRKLAALGTRAGVRHDGACGVWSWRSPAATAAVLGLIAMSGGGRTWTTRATPTCSVRTAPVASSIATRTRTSDCERSSREGLVPGPVPRSRFFEAGRASGTLERCGSQKLARRFCGLARLMETKEQVDCFEPDRVDRCVLGVCCLRVFPSLTG